MGINSKLEKIKQILREKKDVLEKHGITDIGIFGSYVRGDENPSSDLDLLVRLNCRIGLLKFVWIENYLSDILGIKVDLVMRDVLKPTIGKQILKEVKYL